MQKYQKLQFSFKILALIFIAFSTYFSMLSKYSCIHCHPQTYKFFIKIGMKVLLHESVLLFYTILFLLISNLATFFVYRIKGIYKHYFFLQFLSFVIMGVKILRWHNTAVGLYAVLFILTLFFFKKNINISKGEIELPL